MKQLGLKINEQKTEICIFHRNQEVTRTLFINDLQIKTTSSIRILGIIFDSNLNWNKQYHHAITEANQNLYAIKIIAKYIFNVIPLEHNKSLNTSHASSM